MTVEFDPTSYTVSESDRYANITIVKRERTSQTVSVDFSTMDGSATGEQSVFTCTPWLLSWYNEQLVTARELSFAHQS